PARGGRGRVLALAHAYARTSGPRAGGVRLALASGWTSPAVGGRNDRGRLSPVLDRLSALSPRPAAVAAPDGPATSTSPAGCSLRAHRGRDPGGVLLPRLPAGAVA